MSEEFDREHEKAGAPPEPKQEDASPWEEQGYLREISLVVEGLDELDEAFLLPARIRQAIETISNAKKVDDFDRYSDGQLDEFINTLQGDLPRIERAVTEMMNKLNRTQTAAFEVDFI